MENYLTIGLVLISILILTYILNRIYYKIRFYLIESKGRKTGYVYIVSNEVFKDNIFKIGMTERKRYQDRLNELFNTSVPTPFKIEFLIPHSNPREVEKELHNYFSKYRISKKREFFKIDKATLEKELKKLNLI